MQILYEKLYILYANYSIYNYIFLVDYIDENSQDLESCAKKIINSLSRKFGSSPSKTLVILFSMNSKRIRIQPGTGIESKFSSTISS